MKIKCPLKSLKRHYPKPYIPDPEKDEELIVMDRAYSVRPADFEAEDDYEPDDDEYEDMETETELELEAESEIASEV